MSATTTATTTATGARSVGIGRSRRPHQAVRSALGIVGLALALAVWQIASGVMDTVSLPPPAAAFEAVRDLVDAGAVRTHILPSLERALTGFAISAVLGIGLGLTLGYIRWLGDIFSALFNFLRAVPAPLLIPAGLVVFGLGSTMVVAVIVSAAVWPVLINAFDAARRIEPLYLDTARSCGLTGPTLFWRVLLPATLPSIFAGLRVALSMSLAVLVVAEILGASSGLGYLIQNAAQTFAFPQTYAGVLVLGLFGWLLDTAFLLVERRVLDWERGMTGRPS